MNAAFGRCVVVGFLAALSLAVPQHAFAQG